MSHTLKIRAFFFNAKTDYLPYYKNFTFTLEEETSIKEVLALIHEKNENFSYPKQKLIMKINGLVVEAKEKVSALVEKLGTELTIEPVNTYRSNNGLKINDDDFMASYALLSPYASEEDLKYFKTLYALHYASESANFDREYIGDAVLLLAHKMIVEGSAYKAEILQTITSAHSGLMDCEYENNLFNAQDHTQTIEALKDMVNTPENEHPSLLEMFKARFCSKKENDNVTKPKRASHHIENMQEKRIAYCAGKISENEINIANKIVSLGTTEIPLKRRNKLLGVTLMNDNKDLAFKKAGTTLLEAYDAGADLLIIEDEASYDMVAKNFAKIEKIMGRNMIGLEVQLATDFLAQS